MSRGFEIQIGKKLFQKPDTDPARQLKTRTMNLGIRKTLPKITFTFCMGEL